MRVYSPGDLIQIKFGQGLGAWKPAEVIEVLDLGVRADVAGRSVYVEFQHVRHARMRDRSSKPKVQNPFKENADRSSAYMDFVRSKPCMGCFVPGPGDAHHFGAHGTGTKASDFRTVPLCRSCHDGFHATGILKGTASRLETESYFYRKQVDLLIEWMRTCKTT